MYETMIGKYTDKFSELGDVREMQSWAELYYLAPKKRTVTWANLVFSPNLKVWVFSSNSGMYFQQTGFTDNTGLRRLIKQRRVFLVYDAEHEYNLREGMRVVGQNYGVKDIDFNKHYLPLIERLVELDNEENLGKKERSEANIMRLKKEIKLIIEK